MGSMSLRIVANCAQGWRIQLTLCVVLPFS